MQNPLLWQRGRKESQMQQPEPEQQTTDRQQQETAPQQEESSVEQRLAEAERQQQAYKDALLRAQADFVNYKRRAAQEQAEAREVAQGETVEALFPVLDDLGR